MHGPRPCAEAAGLKQEAAREFSGHRFARTFSRDGRQRLSYAGRVRFRVFVSSTFKGMQREARQSWYGRVFFSPHPRFSMAASDLPLYEIDLRWGRDETGKRNLGAIGNLPR